MIGMGGLTGLTGGISLAPLSVAFQVDLTDFKKGMNEASSLGSSTTDKLNNTFKKTKSIASQLGDIGSTLTKKVTMPLVGLGTAAVTTAANFEAGMSEVAAISGATGDDLKALTEKAKEMGSKTKFSASESAEAMKYMAMAGWKTADMLNGIEGIMNLAAASGEDLATTSDIVTDALTAFGLQAKDSAHFADVLAAASSNANTNVSMLGESFKYVAPVAGSLGFSVEDTSLALGLMANSGIKASQAGTALRTALTNLVKPTSNMQKGMDKYGLSIVNADGSMMSLKEIMDMLREKMKVMTEEEKQAVLGLDSMEGMSEAAQQAMEGLTEEEIANAVALELGYEKIEGWTEGQLNAALALSYSKTELKAMSLEEKQHAAAMEQGKIAAEGLTQAEQASTAARVFGKESMSGMLAIINASEEDYNKLTQAIYGADGAAEDMAKTMQDNLKGKITILKSSVEGLAIKLGDILIPKIQSLVERITEGVVWFTNLDESTQSSIVKFGVFAAALGPVLTITSKLITGFSKLRTVFGILTGVGGTGTIGSISSALFGVNTIALPLTATIAGLTAAFVINEAHNKVMNNTILDTTDDMGLLEKAMTDLTGVQAVSKRELVEMGLAYEELGSNLSDEFKTAVNDATKQVNDFNMTLEKANIDGVLTDEEINNFNSQVEQFCQSAINTINSKKDEAQSAMKNFMMSDGVIDEQETIILEFYNRTSTEQINKVNELKDEIMKIKQKALDEQRALNEEEIKAIEEKNAKIKAIELEALGVTEEEKLFAKNEFAARAANIDLQSASDLLKEKAELRNKEIADIKANYDTQIQNLESHLSEMTGEEKKAAQDKIAAWEYEKNEKIRQENSLYDEYLTIIGEKNPKILENINQLNGDILENTDKSYQDTLDVIKKSYDEIDSISTSGLYTLYNKSSETYEKVYVNVDENTGKVIGIWDTYSQKVGGYTKDIAANTRAMGGEISSTNDNIQNALLDTKGTYVNTSGQIVNSNGEIVGSMKNVEYENGKVKSGIIEVNNTPMKIELNKDGTIKNIKEIIDNINSIPKQKIIEIEPVYKDYYSDGRGNVWGGGRWLSGGNHYNGLDYVPYDGYTARLHQGERVLTAKENESYSKSQKTPNEIIIKSNVYLRDEVIANSTDRINGEKIDIEGRRMGYGNSYL